MGFFATLCRTVRRRESDLVTQNEQLRQAVQTEQTARTKSDVAWGKAQERCRYCFSILSGLPLAAAAAVVCRRRRMVRICNTDRRCVCA